MADNEYYDRLKVARGASFEEIKKSYKVLSLKYHPDRNLSNVVEATTKFQEISEAYEILSDPTKRKIYDQFGKDGERQNVNPFNDMFKNAFSGGGIPFGAFAGMQSMFGREQKDDGDTKVKLVVPLSVCYNGSTIKVELPRKSHCPDCDGYGSTDGNDHECSQCGGRGVIIQVSRNGPFMQQRQSPCPGCNGRKFVGEFTPCGGCSGKKMIDDKFLGSITIPKGARDGEEIILHGKGSHRPRNKAKNERCNIVLVVQSSSYQDGHINRCSTDPMNLVTTLKITLSEALCGFSKEIAHLDERIISITCGDICAPGRWLIVMGEGMKKDTGEAGDLIINLQIEYPAVIRNKRSLWMALEACEYTKHVTADNIRLKKEHDEESDKPNEEQGKAPECKTM